MAILFGIFFYSCSQYSQKPASVAYHNFSANYNAYFIAKANLDSAELGIASVYKENPNLLLPILIPFDSVQAKQFSKNLDQAIKNASIIAEKHQNSKWVDNSYTVLGKARCYLGQLDDGIEALRYVLAKSTEDPDKNEALTFLMRAYIEKKEFSNALNVSEYLRQQPLSTGATIDFYLTKAYLHQKTEEYLTSVAILEQTLPLMGKSPMKARIHYIAGQLYDLLGKPEKANEQYARVPKNKPHYDLTFFAKMNSLQNQSLLNPATPIESVGFQKMLRDRKNSDLKDKVYFTMGKISEQKGELPQALEYFGKSVRASTASTKQVPYTYLEMARIYSDKLLQFEPAKAYFDSAMSMMPAGDPAFQQLTERKKMLDQFVAYMSIIQVEDTLQQLARLSPEALNERLDAIIGEQQAARKTAFEKEQAAMAAQEKKDAGATTAPFAGPRWELYDPALVSQGKAEFGRRWGNRNLEDNWRRKTKSGNQITRSGVTAADSSHADTTAASIADNTFKEMIKGSDEWVSARESMLHTVPRSDSALAASHKRKEDALFDLGKMYWNNLKEPANAAKTLNRLLAEYPKSENRQEAYYILCLALPADDPTRQQWKEKLVAEFPNSTYVRLLSSDPNAVPDSPAQNVYEKIYSHYTSGRLEEGMKELDDALIRYRNSPELDRFALLRVFMVGKAKGSAAYKEAILDFMKVYPESQYIPRTKEMLTVVEQAALLPNN